jgi:hypothetical protein
MWVFERRKGGWYKDGEVIKTAMCVFEWFVVIVRGAEGDVGEVGWQRFREMMAGLADNSTTHHGWLGITRRID